MLEVGRPFLESKCTLILHGEFEVFIDSGNRRGTCRGRGALQIGLQNSRAVLGRYLDRPTEPFWLPILKDFSSIRF